MPKAIDERLVYEIFPDSIQLVFNNKEPGELGEDELNFVKAKAKFALLDDSGERLGLKVLEATLWEGSTQLTLAQVTNNLETTLGAALTQARIALTGA